MEIILEAIENGWIVSHGAAKRHFGNFDHMVKFVQNVFETNEDAEYQKHQVGKER